jgi:hypothetical protein
MSLQYMRALSVAGKNLEYGLRKQGLLRFVRELDGNDEEQYDHYLKDASMYARGTVRCRTYVRDDSGAVG